MKALILAAGEGTRLRPLTLDRPKPMLEIGDRPLLEHLVALLRVHGIREIAINLHYRPQAIVRHFEDGQRLGVSITYSPEAELLGSAGAARRLAPFFDGPFLVLYGDVLTNLNLSALVSAHRDGGALATLALYDVDDPSRCGIVELGPNGRVARFIEKPPAGQAHGNPANAGIYVLEPGILRLIPIDRPSDFGRDVFPALLEAGLPIQGVRADGYVLDIGSPERYRQAQKDLRDGRYQPPSRVVAEVAS